jgi:hypothetical protein
MVLNSNGITTSINNGAVGTGYAGIKVAYNSSSAFTTLGVDGGLAKLSVYGSTGVIAAYIQTSGNAGFMDLVDSSGTSAITLDASANNDSAVYLRGSRGITTVSGNIDIGGVYKMDATTIIDASKNASFANVDASGSYKMDGTDIIDTSKNANMNSYSINGTGVIDSSRGVTCVDVNATGVYKMDGTTIIDTAGAFIGAGVACTANGIGGTGYATYQSGWYYGETGPTTFTTTDGKTVTVRGGIITLIV